MKLVGKILASVSYADYSVPGKAMAVGIALHEGQIGVWNIVLNFIFASGMILISVSGIVMWWLRRPEKVLRLAPPPVDANVPLWKGAAVIAVALSIAFPMAGVALFGALIVDFVLISRVPLLRRFLKS